MTTQSQGLLDRALDLLASAPLIDGHNDLAMALRSKVGGIGVSSVDLRHPVEGLDTDIPRLRAGRVGGQFWSVWVPADLPEERALPMALEQLDIADGFAGRYPDVFGRATTADEVETVFAGGRIASLLGLEGGYMIASSLPVLRTFFARGVRYMTLTHWNTTRWADAATDEPQHSGLTAFGREVVREMNRLGMLVDLSHVAPSTMSAALEVAEAPVVFSHSGAYAVNPHPRNVPDDILRQVTGNGGVVMAVFLSQFVSEEVARHVQPAMDLMDAYKRDHPDASGEELHAVRRDWIAANPPPAATIAQVADHIDHLAAKAGVEHVGIGSDLDGGELLPTGLEDVSRFPYLIAELLGRGYSDHEVRGIAAGNVLRVMRAAEAVASRLSVERPPSEATIEELDGGSPRR
jgi:membrane dipeptidase